MIDCIVVGVDGSANAQDALTWAVALARSAGAEIVAVHAVGLREAAREGHDAGAHEALRKQFETEWCESLQDAADVRHRCLLADGDPISVLLRTVESERADLLVVGSRGAGERPELLLGSTSSNVVQRCRVPVVVVPRTG